MYTIRTLQSAVYSSVLLFPLCYSRPTNKKSLKVWKSIGFLNFELEHLTMPWGHRISVERAVRPSPPFWTNLPLRPYRMPCFRARRFEERWQSPIRQTLADGALPSRPKYLCYFEARKCVIWVLFVDTKRSIWSFWTKNGRNVRDLLIQSGRVYVLCLWTRRAGVGQLSPTIPRSYLCRHLATRTNRRVE